MNTTNPLLDHPSRRAFAAGCVMGLALPLGSLAATKPAPAAPPPAVVNLTASPDRTALPTPRKLSAQEREWARIAWKYFEKNTDAHSGLPGSVENYPSGTMWDMGSYLLALDAAQQLALINRQEFDRRTAAALSALSKLGLFDKQFPNKAYNTQTLKMTDYTNAPSGRGVGWSAIDMGRMVVALHALGQQHPQHAAAANALLTRWRPANLVRDGELIGGRVDKDSATEPVQEGRLGYEQYAARAFALIGLKAPKALDYKRQMALVEVEGIKVAHDRRTPAEFGAHNYVISEPYVLDGLEFGWDATSRELAWRVFAAQQKRHQRTGVLTAVTEDHIDQKPYFVYNTVYSSGKAWNTITDTGEDASAYRCLSVKAAFGWYALIGNDYTRKLVQGVAPLHDPARGWFGGLYEATGKPNKSINANTNAVVLQSLAFIENGPLLRRAAAQGNATVARR